MHLTVEYIAQGYKYAFVKIQNNKKNLGAQNQIEIHSDCESSTIAIVQYYVLCCMYVCVFFIPLFINFCFINRLQLAFVFDQDPLQDKENCLECVRE